MELNLNQVKEKSEEKLKNFGVNINPNLPEIDYNGVRSRDDIIKRYP
jgi:hypothetical protein